MQVDSIWIDPNKYPYKILPDENIEVKVQLKVDSLVKI